MPEAVTAVLPSRLMRVKTAEELAATGWVVDPDGTWHHTTERNAVTQAMLECSVRIIDWSRPDSDSGIYGRRFLSLISGFYNWTEGMLIDLAIRPADPSSSSVTDVGEHRLFTTGEIASMHWTEGTWATTYTR